MNSIKYNLNYWHKQSLIAVSKSDMLDEELTAAIKKELPDNIPHVFISSITNRAG